MKISEFFRKYDFNIDSIMSCKRTGKLAEYYINEGIDEDAFIRDVEHRNRCIHIAHEIYYILIENFDSMYQMAKVFSRACGGSVGSWSQFFNLTLFLLRFSEKDTKNHPLIERFCIYGVALIVIIEKRGNMRYNIN